MLQFISSSIEQEYKAMLFQSFLFPTSDLLCYDDILLSLNLHPLCELD